MMTNLSREYDRFIPHRNLGRTCHPDASLNSYQKIPQSTYSHLIKKNLFTNMERKVISFSQKENQECQIQTITQSFPSSTIQSNVDSPVKILDLPNYRDDFYLNNVDWSQHGPLGIALDNEVFLYTPQNLVQLCKAPFGSYVSGIKIQDYIMAVGFSNGIIQIYDLERNNIVRTLHKHENRVAAFAFVDGLLVSGSKDKSVVVHDLRERDHVIREFNHHKGEVCTLKAKNKTEKIFASGSGDGNAIVWDVQYGKIHQMKAHKGAIKALDWCPWKNGLLATGGGSVNDKSIKLWNTSNGNLVLDQPIDSQISGLLWNQQLKIMTTSHGYNENQIKFWSLETGGSHWHLQNRKSFQGHSMRILSLLQSYDSNYLCTVGADENLKFWNLRESDSNPFRRNFVESRSDIPYRL